MKLNNKYQKRSFIKCNFNKTKEWIKKQNQENLFEDFDDKHEAYRVINY